MYSFYDYLPKAQVGRTQTIEDYPDYGAYRAAMENGNDYYDQGYSDQPIDSSAQQVQWHPEWNSQDPQQAYYDQAVAASQAQAAQPTMAMPIARKANPNVSIVDYLNKNGEKSDYATRKAMAESLGITNYRGRDTQNTQLLHMLVNNINKPTADSTVVPITTPKVRTDSSGNPIPKVKGSGVTTSKKSESTFNKQNVIKLGAIAGSLLAAAGLGAIEFIHINSLIEKGLIKDPVGLKEAVEQLRNNAVSKATGAMENSYNSFKALDPRQRKILDVLDANEISGVAHTLEPGSADAHINAWRMGNEANAENMLMTDRTTTQALADAQEEAKAMRMFNGQKAAAARWNKEVPSLGKPTTQMLKEAWMAAKSTPWIAKSAKFLSKLKGFEEGGENEMYQKGGYIGYDGNHHDNGGHGTYSDGVYFQDGGEEMNYGGMYMQFGGHSSPRVDYSVAAQPFAGYMQDGGINNPGFQALPDYVQNKILSNMQDGGDLGFSPMYAQGGIHLDPAKRGTFTAAATKHGKSVQGFASQVLGNKDNYSPAMVKKANFARNASKWNHAEGGAIGNYQVGGSYNVSPQELERLKSLGYKIQIQ